MKRSFSTLLDPSKEESFMKHSLTSCNRMKRKSHSEINDQKKKKPALTPIRTRSSSQSLIIDNKPEKTRLDPSKEESVMEHSLSACNSMKRKSHSEINDEKKKKLALTPIRTRSSSRSLIIGNKPEKTRLDPSKEPVMKHSLSACNSMKRKSHSDINDQKKKKPALTPIRSSSQSLILDNKPEKLSTKMTGGESSRSLCGICFDLKTDSDMFKRKSCNHLFCVECVSKYVDSQINNNVVKVACPTPNCSAKLEPRHLQHILPREFIDRWELAMYESEIALDEKTYCPFKNCSVLLVNDNDRGVVLTSCECPSCHRLFCAQCKVPWHAEMNCQEFQDLKRRKKEQDLDDKFLELAKRNKWQRCPNCSIYVKRSDGCEHMKCRCKCNFCYHCGKEWKHGHLCEEKILMTPLF